MSGSKGAPPKTQAKDFLPFPDLDKQINTERIDGPSAETKKVLTELVKTFRIPVHVFTALNSQVEQRT